ncbi:MAG TPA: PqqD family protein [Gemmatimonadaceae bacterium]|nr:PqqD family protein [Gemmatimonadaceae bacterium]
MIELYVPNSGVLFQRFADGAVVYSPGDESYFGLNGTGAEVWNLLPKEGASFDDVIQKMIALYPEAPESDLRTDLGDLLDELVKHGLMRRVTAEAAA